MSDATHWEIASSVATVLATALAGAGLVATALTMKAATRAQLSASRAQELATLTSLIQQTREAELRILAAPTDEIRTAEFLNYLNFLEVQAIAVNSNLYGAQTMRVAEERLKNDLAIIFSFEDYSRLLIEARSSQETFTEIFGFLARHEAEITKRKLS